MSLALIPMFLLVCGLVLVIVTDLIKPSANRSYNISLLTVTLSFLSQVFTLNFPPMEVWKPIDQVLDFDPLSQGFSSLALILAFLAIGMSKDSFDEAVSKAGEYYSLIITATLGAVLVAHSEELLTFFLAFELLSIPLYILAGFKRYHRKSAEAGLKYFLSGALSSAIFLFGASWIFGACGSTHYAKILDAFEQGHGQPVLLGILMIIGAFAFKMAAAPFHMWAPDTYEGSPIPVAAFLSTVPKVAMIAASLRVFLKLTDVLAGELAIVLAALSILSVVMGNLVALTQTEMTRLAAYSGVAQMGYLMIGLASVVRLDGAGRYDLVQEALGSLFFYLLIYTITNFAFWTILLLVGHQRKSTRLEAFDGLSQTSPFLAFALLLTVFSLAGVPPLAGFVGKLFLFRAAFYAQPLMALFGVIGSVISLYYYFNILRRCYFLHPQDPDETFELSASTKGLLGSLLLLTTLGGIFPWLTQVCFQLAERMLLL
ncbi:MAG: NADH-quinone oxidoreductase subunit N [Candidatus Eremiobacteraeota bacterium]|nr:NADH-quinone oxidoreductase subunit N [Candidatus Eremiobacteraeota bacterium]